jgi:hypothetical protein
LKFSAATALTAHEVEPTIEAANRMDVFFHARALKAGISGLLSARFHAHLIFRLARRTGVVLHASLLLLGTDLARLSLGRAIGSEEHSQH